MSKPVMMARLAAVGTLAALAACAVRPVEAPVDSLTVSRVMGHDIEVPPLLPQSGSVWPEQEGPRGTIGNPDAATRPGELAPNQPTPRMRRGSSTPPDLFPPVTDTAPDLRPPDAPPAPVYAPPARADGRVIPTPQGPAVTTGGGPGYSTYTMPGGASGIAIPQGGTTTLMDGNGTVRQVPTPR
jgi:hypothetical protein